MIYSAEEFVALSESDDPESYRRASTEAASEEVWAAVIRDYPDHRFWVAQNKTVPVSILEILAGDPDDRVRDMVAQKRKLPADLMERLGRDRADGIRLAIAHNRSTPPHVLEMLLDDRWERVVEVALARLREERRT